MSGPPTVVLGDDGTEAADTAWAWIAAHGWAGWRLEVVHATSTVGPPPPPDEARLHPWDPPHPRHPGPSCAFLEVAHLEARLDPRLALTQPTDLLVVGPRAPGLLKAMPLGSTAEWLLQHPPSPLVIARRGAPVRRVLACVDGSSHARRALGALADMPWIADVEVVVLRVDEGWVDPSSLADPEATLAEACAVLDAAGASTSTVLAPGRATATIVAAAGSHAVDLVVLGTRGLTGLRRLRLGSTAAAVARSVSCSTLLAFDDTDHDHVELHRRPG